VLGKLRKFSEGKNILSYFFGKQLQRLFLKSVLLLLVVPIRKKSGATRVNQVWIGEAFASITRK